ncbi:GIY-YIG nuclease family protein [Candidatus Pacearchaeota archaeon]|nr:GIY-YIG nuclease family protein [Candidatus Pacearchaeota archaeon]
MYYAYILASNAGVLYVGMTNDIKRRVYEHKNHLVEGFTSKYLVDRLMYFEGFDRAELAINREKQIKKWGREKKVKLIDSVNSKWDDLAADWYD